MSTGNGDINKSADAESGGSMSPNKETKEATKKIIRVLTVMAYLSSVSMAAIMLSLYYIFLWNPMPSHAARTMQPAPHTLHDVSTTMPVLSPPANEPRSRGNNMCFGCIYYVSTYGL